MVEKQIIQQILDLKENEVEQIYRTKTGWTRKYSDWR